MKRSFIAAFLLLMSFRVPAQFLVPAWFDPDIHADKIQYISENGISIYLENLEVNDRLMVFDLEVVNETPYSMSMDPASLRMFGSDVAFSPEELYPGSIDSEAEEAMHPLSREEVAAVLRTMIHEKKEAGTLFGLITTGLVILDVALDIKHATSREWTPGKQFGADLRNLLTMAGIATTDAIRQQNRFKAMERHDDLVFLDQEIFSFEELPARSHRRGKVFFPLDDAPHIRMVLGMQDTDFLMDFRIANRRDVRVLER